MGKAGRGGEPRPSPWLKSQQGQFCWRGWAADACLCDGVRLGRGWASPPELPLALGQHRVQKSLSAEGSDGAGCSAWQKSPGKGCVAPKPRCSQRSGAKSPEKNGVPDQTARTQCSPTSLRLQEQPPAPCPGQKQSSQSQRTPASTWPGVPKEHRKAPGTPGCSPKGREKILKA